MTTASRILLTCLAGTAVGGVLFVGACGAPLPTAPVTDDVEPPTTSQVEAAPQSREPYFTPMTVRPVLTNAGVVRDRLMAEYPALLRDAGIGGTPVVWIHIAATGEVDDARVFESSGFDALDQAALNVARAMVFEPARNGDAVTDAWVQLPIRFAVVQN